MLDELLFLFLGLLSSGCFIYSSYTVSRKRILLLQAAGSVIVSLQFATINIWGVAAVNSVFILRNLFLTLREHKLSTKTSKFKNENLLWAGITLLLLLPIYLLANPYNATDFRSILIWTLPLLAGLGNIVSIAQKKVIRLKIFTLITSTLWASFDVATGAWTTLIGDSFSIIACLYAIHLLRKNQQPLREQ